MMSSNSVSAPRIIGLTGGIAAGKSTVCGRLQDHGVAIIDADKLGHNIYDKSNVEVFNAVREAFSDVENIVDEASGQINRRALGGVVFGSAERMKHLTDIVWPAMQVKLEAEIARVVEDLRHESKSPHPFVRPTICVEAAVLIEAKWTGAVDEVWVVEVPLDVARARLMARNNLSEDEANKRISAQITAEQRRPHANVVITNINKQDAFQQVDEAVAGWETKKQASAM